MKLTRFLMILLALAACANPVPQQTAVQSDQICPSGERIEFYDLYESSENRDPENENPAETIVMGLRCVLASTD